LNAGRRAAALLAVACIGAAGCGGGGDNAASDPGLTADVQAFVAVKGAVDNLTRTLQLVATADDTVSSLRQAGPSSGAARRFRDGAELSWNNVVVGLNGFTAGQAKAVPGLADSIEATRVAAIAWQNALGDLQGTVGTGRARRKAVAKALAEPRQDETAARAKLRSTAAMLAQLACALERRRPELAPAGAAASDCAAARQLSTTTAP
jgi:hypothetical protein